MLRPVILFVLILLIAFINVIQCQMSNAEKHELKEKVLQMFDHAFQSYMVNSN